MFHGGGLSSNHGLHGPPKLTVCMQRPPVGVWRGWEQGKKPFCSWNGEMWHYPPNISIASLWLMFGSFWKCLLGTFLGMHSKSRKACSIVSWHWRYSQQDCMGDCVESDLDVCHSEVCLTMVLGTVIAGNTPWARKQMLLKKKKFYFPLFCPKLNLPCPTQHKLSFPLTLPAVWWLF